jgi:hypothetical protein
MGTQGPFPFVRTERRSDTSKFNQRVLVYNVDDESNSCCNNLSANVRTLGSDNCAVGDGNNDTLTKVTDFRRF